MIKLYLFDIEGTTTDIKFVHNVLFPYSEKHIEKFVIDNGDQPAVQSAIKTAEETLTAEEEMSAPSLNDVLSALLKWIKEDRKHPALKELQGLIWDRGYSQKDFQGHVYPDVAPFFRKIKEKGQKIGIYSSGSVHAQKLIFGYSSDGDLTPFISYFFDTKVGGKREPKSYSTIVHEVKLLPQEIMFFSDIPEELEAAKAAGMRVTHVLRPGTKESSFQSVTNFLPLMEIL